MAFFEIYFHHSVVHILFQIFKEEKMTGLTCLFIGGHLRLGFGCSCPRFALWLLAGMAGPHDIEWVHSAEAVVRLFMGNGGW